MKQFLTTTCSCLIILLVLRHAYPCIFEGDDKSWMKNLSMVDFGEVNSDKAMSMTLSYANNSIQTTYIDRLDSVHRCVQPLCNLFRNLSCNDIEDQISHRLHGHYYTPILPSATIAEYEGSRHHVVHYFHSTFQYKRYLEIGCDIDNLFGHVRGWFDLAIGVDPRRGGTLRTTSDEFFGANTQYFDLIFIDGLHEANQVFRDVQNALRWLAPGGTILMHDCNPRNLTAATFPMPKEATYWNGDTFKAAVALRLLPDVEFVVVDIDYGVGVLRRRPNLHPLSQQWQSFLSVSPISMLTYELFDAHREELVRLVSLQDMCDWLDEELTAVPVPVPVVV